ncbi:MAG: DUF6602 domain-containing protein [Methanotrichaceae archaeon]|jgi:hypothetical protein
MPGQQDFLEYHKSIAAELQATKDRVQYLIGGQHWLTVGENKEAILRKVLKGHIAETLHVGTGFVCGPHETSHQTDILISSRDKPILFGDGELRIITPDMAIAIIEVKTKVKIHELSDILQKLADDVKMIRNRGNQKCMAGLFCYEFEDEDANNVNNEYNVNHINNMNHMEEMKTKLNGLHERILRSTQKASNRDKKRAINWIAAGPNIFIRYWNKGGDVLNFNKEGPVWHSYCLKGLAHAYFLSNVVWDTCPKLRLDMQYAWFPIEGGKERYRQWYVGLKDDSPMSFDNSEVCLNQYQEA